MVHRRDCVDALPGQDPSASAKRSCEKAWANQSVHSDHMAWHMDSPAGGYLPFASVHRWHMPVGSESDNGVRSVVPKFFPSIALCIIVRGQARDLAPTPADDRLIRIFVRGRK